MAARNGSFVKPFFELFQKKSSYHLFLDGRRIRLLNLLTLPFRVLFSRVRIVPGGVIRVAVGAVEAAVQLADDPVILL